jgi:Neuraminidase (sialidase)
MGSAPQTRPTDSAPASRPARGLFQQEDVFLSGQGGYHTYRIPAVVVCGKGTVLAFCEGRRKGTGADGSVYLNMRSHHGAGRRAAAWSKDGGLTWSDVKLDDALVEPVCQASVLRLTGLADRDKARMLFANPAGAKREKLTVRLSDDGGKTWPVARVIHEGSAAYCDLAALGDGTILCLYERQEYSRITLARFDLAWLGTR